MLPDRVSNPGTPDLRVRCPTDCATRPGGGGGGGVCVCVRVCVCVCRGVARPNILLRQAFLRYTYISEYVHLQAR